MNHELLDVYAGVRKGRGTRDQIANIRWIIEKARVPEKTSTSALLNMSKPLTAWIIPAGSDGKESGCNSTPGSGRSPGGGHGNPLQYFCLENSHGQRSLVGYNPWGCKESDTSE